MSALVLDPSVVAEAYRAEVRRDVAALTASGRSLRIVGLLGRAEGPAATYARYAQRGCVSVGVDMEIRHVGEHEAAEAITTANLDPAVDGIFLYYPLTDAAQDRWLRELVDPRKDVEGMHSFWSRLLYENRRHLDPRPGEDQGDRTILPCTPLAILKMLQYAGMRGSGAAAPLDGVTACVINRSDIVGRPLSAMLANDGAPVFSLDVFGTAVFEPAIGRHAHTVSDSDVDRTGALAAADVVITGVPAADFELVRADEIREGAICVNVSENKNFDDSILERASTFVPRLGPLTIAMATRNLVRLAAMRPA